jgi:hypothetical protein
MQEQNAALQAQVMALQAALLTGGAAGFPLGVPAAAPHLGALALAPRLAPGAAALPAAGVQPLPPLPRQPSQQALAAATLVAASSGALPPGRLLPQQAPLLQAPQQLQPAQPQQLQPAQPQQLQPTPLAAGLVPQPAPAQAPPLMAAMGPAGGGFRPSAFAAAAAAPPPAPAGSASDGGGVCSGGARAAAAAAAAAALAPPWPPGGAGASAADQATLEAAHAANVEALRCFVGGRDLSASGSGAYSRDGAAAGTQEGAPETAVAAAAACPETVSLLHRARVQACSWTRARRQSCGPSSLPAPTAGRRPSTWPRPASRASAASRRRAERRAGRAAAVPVAQLRSSAGCR